MTIYIAEKLTELLSDYINRYNILSCRCVIITGQEKEDFISTGMITQGIPFSPGLPDLLLERDLLQSNRDFIISSDAFDALTADRAYRKGLTDLQALEIIKRQAGIHYDSDMVTIFENQIFPGLSETWRSPNELTAKLSSTVLESLSVQQKAKL